MADRLSRAHGSKQDGTGFTNIRKKKTINSYKKLLRKEKRDDALAKVIQRQKQKKSGFKVNTYAKYQKETEERYKQIEEERINQKKEQENKLKEREEAKKAAEEKRKQRKKLFSKKTRKGQPYLHNQMTLLLEKIENNMKKEAIQKH